ncbi:hypothetical protein ACEWY4_018754 [Coilia grayii]|uniref:B box-type domain-containing protein n=1 Tax=Coilia grayii TaxID=363190 RepID=A0ABD1JFB5_9TELE
MSSISTRSQRPSLASSIGSFSSSRSVLSSIGSFSSARSGRSASSTSSTGSACSTDCNHEERPMVVFCDTCSQPLCDNCLTGVRHLGHNFKTLEEACKDQQDNITQHLRELESKINEHGDIQQWKREQEEQLEGEFARVRDHLTEQYQELQALLDHSKEQAMRLLEAQRDSQRKPLYRLQEDGENYKAQTEHLYGQIANLKERMSSERMSTERYAEILVRLCVSYIFVHIDMFNEFYGKATPKHKLDKLRLEALEKSIQYVTEKVKEIFPRPWEFYRDITFSEDNIPQVLSLSDDHTQVTLTGPNKAFTVQNQAEEKPVHILAEESFKDGRHYWEVDVQDCSGWAVGVVELSQGKKLQRQTAERHLGRDRSSWMLESLGGELVALHDDDLTRVKEQDVKSLGVYLDISKKGKSQLTFYDVGSCTVLHTFYLRTKKSICPAFSLFYKADEASSLALCNFGLNPQPPNDFETGSVDSGVVFGLPDIESSYTSRSNSQSSNASESIAGSSPTLESIPELSSASESNPEHFPTFESSPESSPTSESIPESSPTSEPTPESSPATESVQESLDTPESIPESSPKRHWKKFKGLFKR